MKAYVEGQKVAEAKGHFEHVMAIALDPRSNYRDGVIRCIVSREGDVNVKGYIDRSQLYKVRAKDDGTFDITDRLEINNQQEIVNELMTDGDFIGLEDPDIWIDENNLMHVYFTMPFIQPEASGKNSRIHLGHAVGETLDSLVMTKPVLLGRGQYGAKEVSIAPLNSKGLHNNLVESSDIIDSVYYSTIKVAIAHDMGKEWKFGSTVFHPAEHDIYWAGEHASPGPLFPKSFIDLGGSKLLGVMNGREKSDRSGSKTIYKTFSIGLMIYDFEKGEIDWVSPEPLIRDSEATTITFASQFVEENGRGTLYAHVDDSFVRSYELNARALKELIPNKFL